jgi:hypothetical protein
VAEAAQMGYEPRVRTCVDQEPHDVVRVNGLRSRSKRARA